MHNIHHLHPKFSIITVTYNAGAVLEDTIQSVITQTYKNVEYIIVDGGSKDRTLQIVEQYKEHIHTVISELDKGLYEKAFCKIYPDVLVGDDDWVNVMHADGAQAEPAR